MKREVKSSGRLEKKLNNFTEEQRKLLFENTGAVQLTKGCNSACPDCGVAALKGVQDMISYNTLDKMFTTYGKELKKSSKMLYYASEPFDYKDGEHNYMSVHNLYKEKVNKDLCLITSLPVRQEEGILKTLKEESGKKFNEREITAVSLTNYNYKRVEKRLKESGLLDDIDGVDSLEDFGKFINQNSFGNNPVRDFKNEHKRYNLGGSNTDNLSEESIGCFHGVLMDPTGVYNIKITTPTPKNPTGEIIEEITPENFKVMPYFSTGKFVSNDLFLSEGDKNFLKL